METVLLAIHLVACVAIIGIVLIQRSEGGGLGIGNSSMGGLMTARGTANFLTKITITLAAIMMASTLGIAILHKTAAKPASVIDTIVEQNKAQAVPDKTTSEKAVTEPQKADKKSPEPAKEPAKAAVPMAE